MYLLYLDESGTSANDHFVIGGLAVHEQDVIPMSEAVDRLMARQPIPMTHAEIHASPIRVGRGRWGLMGQQLRNRLTFDIVQLLTKSWSDSTRKPTLFATAIHRASFPHYDLHERTYEEFFARPNGFLGRLASKGERHRCIAISDKSKLESHLQSLMSGWRTTGGTTGASIPRLASYVEVPMFVDSRMSRLIQLADFVAHWVYRAYEHNDSSVLNQLINVFDSEGGTYHGLVHLTAQHRTCDCVACRSRR